MKPSPTSRREFIAALSGIGARRLSNVAAEIAGLRGSGFTAAELRGIYRDNALKILPALAR